LRHGLSFARRSATRFTKPFHDWAGPVGAFARSGNAHGISCALRSVPWRRGSPHFCGSSPHAVSRFAPLHLSYPLIFTGAGRAFELLPQEAGVVLMRPAFATHAPPTGFWVVLPRPSRACAFVHARPFRRLSQWMPRCVYRARAHANPAMGFSVLLSGVLDAVSAARAFAHARHRTQAHRQSPQPYLSLGCHPLVGFLANCCRTCARAPVFSRIELQRRHPCRRRPFSVFGRFAPSHSERSRSSHCR
jgi:hypothetical protein